MNGLHRESHRRSWAPAGFLRDFDHSLVFSEHELIAELLAAANRLGVECLTYTKSELCALAASGIYSGAPGQPAPRHVHDKAEAERLANVYASNDPVRKFYRSLIALAETNMRIDVDSLGGRRRRVSRLTDQLDALLAALVPICGRPPPHPVLRATSRP